MKRFRNLLVIVVALVVTAPLSLWAAPIPKLASPPLGERWFSIVVGGERVGFAHLTIKSHDDGYEIDSDSSVKMTVMGFSREAATKEKYFTAKDLSLRSFVVEQRIDKSPMSLSGEATPKGIKVAVVSGGRKKEKNLKTKGTVYPPEVLNIYPLLLGGESGKTYKVRIFDPDSVKVKEVKVEVVGEEKLAPAGTPSVHLRNNLYPMVDNDIWVDLQGNTIKESVRDDLVVTTAEDQESAKKYLADAALSKMDLVLDFSLIKVDRPIEKPDALQQLTVEFTGIPRDFPLLQGPRQKGERLPDGRVRFLLPHPDRVTEAKNETAAANLEPAARIPSDDPVIAAKEAEIAGSEKDPARVVKLLVTWVSKEIKGDVTDNQSPLETLKNRKGNCQTHARLYTALARAAGIPTRFVSGVVYAPGKGFLYHSWAESYVSGSWMPVDPTFGEIPANLTHIKLVDGDTPDDMALLAGIIGKVKAKVTEIAY